MPRQQDKALFGENAESLLVSIGLAPRPAISEKNLGCQLRGIGIGHIEERNRRPSQLHAHGNQSIAHGLDVGGPSGYFQFTAYLGGFGIGKIDNPERIHAPERHHVGAVPVIASRENRLISYQVQTCQTFRLGHVLQRKGLQAHHRRIRSTIGTPTRIDLRNDAQNITIQTELKLIGHSTNGVQRADLADKAGPIGNVKNAHPIARRQWFLRIGRIQSSTRINGGGEEEVAVRGMDGLRHGLEFHARPEDGLGGIGQIHSAHPGQRLEDCGPLGIRSRYRAIRPSLAGDNQDITHQAALHRIPRQHHIYPFLWTTVRGLNQNDLGGIPTTFWLSQEGQPLAGGVSSGQHIKLLTAGDHR